MRALPQDNLAYPVLIILNTGSMGTGCVINAVEGNYLATAKHVLFDEKNNLKGNVAILKSYTPDLVATDFTKFTLDLNIVTSNSNIIAHTNHDVCLVRLLTKDDQGNSTHTPGVTLDNLSSRGVCGININTTVKMYQDVLISNDVFIFGYPASIGLRNSPQFNSEIPLLRKGIVAGKNDQNSTIILDCPVYQGNSGGPVIEVEHMPGGISYKLIGLVSQFVPVEDHWKNLSFGIVNTQWSNSGYSVVVPVDFINDLINQLNATTTTP
ncbi:MAG TPA: serine protease [Pseudomonadales bacterium]